MATIPPQRLAVMADVPQISVLMRESIAELFPHFYDAQQTASGLRFIAVLDEDLIADGTYFVHEDADEIVACGGWSRRDKLFAGVGDAAGTSRLLDPATEPARVRAMFVRGDYTRRGIGRAILAACEAAARAEGFTRLALMATLPGEPLYRAYGFEGDGPVDIVLPDGVNVPGVPMERAIA